MQRTYISNLHLKTAGWAAAAFVTATGFGSAAQTVMDERNATPISEFDVRNDPGFMTRYHTCLSNPSTPPLTAPKTTLQQVDAMRDCEGQAIARTRLAIAWQRHPDRWNAKMAMMLAGCALSLSMVIRLKVFGTDKPPAP